MKKNCYLFLFTVISVTSLAQNKNTAYESYIDNYSELAIIEQQRHSIPASITLAQALLESSAGQSELAISSNNHFGIKCHSTWQGKRVYHNDDRKNECFRQYDKVIDSYEDHSMFLKRDRYKTLYTYAITDYKAWAKGLKAAGYATDPKYPDKLIKIIEDYELYRFDNPQKARQITEKYDKQTNKQKQRLQTAVNTDSSITIPANSSESINMYPIHEVLKNNKVPYIKAKANDTWQTIAQEFGMNVRELKRINEMQKNQQVEPNMRIYLKPKKNKSLSRITKHTVQSGESMHSISQEYGIKMNALYKINQLEKWSPVQIGMILKLNK